MSFAHYNKGGAKDRREAGSDVLHDADGDSTCGVAQNGPLSPQQRGRPSVEIRDIQYAVVRRFNVSLTDILSARIDGRIARARAIAIYLTRTLTPHMLKEIGHRFGDRAPSTISLAVNKTSSRLVSDAALANDIAALKAELGAAAQSNP